MRSNPVAAWVVLVLVLAIDALSPFGSTVFLPKAVDTVIDLAWIGVNGAAIWGVGPSVRALIGRRW